MVTVKRASSSSLGFLITMVVVAEILIFMPSSTVQDIKKPEQVVVPASDANLSIEGFHAVNWNEEGRKEIIDAEQAELFREQGFSILKKVEARIYTSGDNIIHITASQGKYYLEKKDIEFAGDIVATSENQGYQLKTNSLKYIENEKSLLTDDAVWIVGPNPQAPSLEVTGIGLRANTKTEEFSILKDVHSKKHDVNADSIDIDSDRAQVFSKKNQALFESNVVVKQKDMNIYTDNFLIDYNGKNKAIDKAVAYDVVKIVQQDRVATCTKAFLLNRQQKIVLTGSPKVVQGNDTVVGKVVVFFTKEKKILFDDAVGEVKDVEALDLK